MFYSNCLSRSCMISFEYHSNSSNNNTLFRLLFRTLFEKEKNPLYFLIRIIENYLEISYFGKIVYRLS